MQFVQEIQKRARAYYCVGLIASECLMAQDEYVLTACKHLLDFALSSVRTLVFWCFVKDCSAKFVWSSISLARWSNTVCLARSRNKCEKENDDNADQKLNKFNSLAMFSGDWQDNMQRRCFEVSAKVERKICHLWRIQWNALNKVNLVSLLKSLNVITAVQAVD